jgi:sugar phosphate isomerase/epimerase
MSPALATASVPKAPNVDFPSDPQARLAVSSWSFHDYIKTPRDGNKSKEGPGMDLPEFAVWVKREFNVPGVEPWNHHFASLDDHYLSAFRESNEKAGVRIVNIAVDNSHSYYDADPAVRRQALNTGKAWVDAAQKLNAVSIRTSIAKATNAQPDVEVVAAQLKELACYAADRNVVVNLENDNLVSEDAFFLVKVIDKVNHPFLHALPDFCNSMQTRNEKFNYDALTQLFARAYNICHVKEIEGTPDGKTVSIDLKRVFAILKASHYKGFFSMEWEGNVPPQEGTRHLLKACEENLR